MSVLRLSRLILICVFAFVILAAGYVSYNYYIHLCSTERLNYLESRKQTLDKIYQRLQTAWNEAVQEAVDYSTHLIAKSEGHYSKALKIIEESHSEVRRAFYLDEEAIYLPQWRKFRISKQREDLSLGFSENPEFKRAEILEYQDNQLEAAVKVYESLWLNSPDNFQAANALARCLFKLNNLERAEKIYRQIFSQNPGASIQGDVPLAVIAGFQLLTIYQNLQDQTKVREFGGRLYSDFLEERWELSRVKSVFYKSKVRAILEKDLGDSGFKQQFQSLLQREKELEQLKGDIALISERVIPFVEGSNFEGYVVYFLPTSFNRQDFLLIAPYQKGHLVLDVDYARCIQNHLLEPLATLAKDYGVAIRLHGAGLLFGGPIPKAEAVELLPLAKDFPDLKLELAFSDTPARQLAHRLVSFRAYFIAGYGAFALVLLLVFLVLSKQIQFAELKSDFVSHVSHELKTPLTSLRMFSEMLLSQPRLAPKKRRQYYAIMNEESIRLSRLIENLLDISRIERKHTQFYFKKENVDWVLKTAVEIFEGAVHKQKHILQLDLRSGREMSLDKDALIQMTINLLDNARKFSPAGSVISLSSAAQDSRVVLIFKDQGTGIKRADLRKVFKKFYQVKRTYEDNFKGVGLGLAIVKTIVQAHKGKIVLDSEPGHGTTVTVTLPVR